MNRIIPISLLIFWAMQFALQLIAAVKGVPLALLSPFDLDGLAAQLPSDGLAAPVLAVVSGLIAALFLWAAVSVAASSGEDGDHGEDVVRIAYCAAIVTVTAFSVLSAFQGSFVPFAPVAILMVALAVSWMASLNELAREPEGTLQDDEGSRQVASLMAGEAAHKAMLGALTGRPFIKKPRKAG